MITAAAAGAATFFTSSVSSFHRPRLRPCPRRRLTVVPPARATSSSGGWEEREEARWLREEQRWLREEQRWLREESRWRDEREALLAEVAALRLRLRSLEGLPPHHLAAVDAVATPAPPAAVPAPQPRPALVEEVEVTKEVVVVDEKTTKAAPPSKADEPASGSGAGGKKSGRRKLRAGAEGEDVRAMQEALEKLGFYSGEEDMEYSSFSSGTERAVKTWQASVGTSEDGVMTSELLEILFAGKTGEEVKANDAMNGTAARPVTGIAEVRKTVVTENGGASAVGVSEHRVFLLGENRWEDPSRLTPKKPTSTANDASTKTCIVCRGEGRLMCTECDGSGEPNVEPQFLEWVGEDTKCPYCEGLGSIICDVCYGKTVVAT